MKRKARKLLLCLIALLLLLTAAPLTGLTGENLTPKAAAATYQVGDLITFGGYPQSRVTDSATLSALDALEKTWISYRYYSGTGAWYDGQMQAGDWMRWADFMYNGAKYRAVTFDSYRPYYTGGTASAGTSYQGDNGYTPGNVYYFKYESLKWRVLDPAVGLVLCESIIDAQAYQNVIYYNSSDKEYYQGPDSSVYANDYATSSIRAWLTEDFYNAAFSPEEKNLIGETTLDNSAYSTSYANYNSASTTDKIYLLSYSDMLNPAYGFSSSSSSYDAARRAQGTDYAKCQGLYVYSSGDYAGNSYWRLRSPGSSSRFATDVSSVGWVYDTYSVRNTYGGVRPAFRFKSGILESSNPNGGGDSLQGPYTVAYDAVGGAGAPGAQTKTYGTALILDSSVPVKSYTISYNANGGAVAPANDTRVCTFTGWNTAENGSGTAYAPGGSYTAETDATLYAQWQNPTYGTLPTPVRENYAFAGWFTAQNGGTQATSSTVVTKSQTLYARWKNLYNRGEETYRFVNFGDQDAPYGHCLGMSVTSAGYYLGLLDVGTIGLNTPQQLYAAQKTKTVTDPICYYQPIQGHYLANAVVAGNEGTIGEQWKAAVEYVKNHAFDGKGMLTITIRTHVQGTEYGHALTFLRYENVKGQDRIYAYDNETPTFDTYFYLTNEGVRQAPDTAAYAPFPITYKFALNDVATYFENARGYQSSRALYAEKGSVRVEGAAASAMLGEIGGTPWIMYELPEAVDEVEITALKADAAFTYRNNVYSFGMTAAGAAATLTLAAEDADPSGLSDFTIHAGHTFLPGDVSGDGQVTAEDARLALRAAVGLENYEKEEPAFLTADANHDGTITAADARLILRAAVGLENLS